jgi:tetratricopeptide (TPR) repeat protein
VAGWPAREFQHALGACLLRTDDAEGAVEVLGECYRDRIAAGDPRLAIAETLYLLGRAHAERETWDACYRRWTEATVLLRLDRQFAEAVAVAKNLGIALLRHGDPRAVEVYRDALDDAAQIPDDTWSAATLRSNLGYARLSLGDPAGFGDLDEAERLCRVGGGASDDERAWFLADVDDSRARGHSVAGRPDQAIVAFLRAADEFAAAGDDESAGHSTVFAAQLLARVDRVEEAAAAYRSAVNLLKGQDRIDAAQELADVLARPVVPPVREEPSGPLPEESEESDATPVLGTSELLPHSGPAATPEAGSPGVTPASSPALARDV